MIAKCDWTETLLFSTMVATIKCIHCSRIKLGYIGGYIRDLLAEQVLEEKFHPDVQGIMMSHPALLFLLSACLAGASGRASIRLERTATQKLFGPIQTNSDTGESASVAMTAPVSEGPSDVSITAPKIVVNGGNYTLKCSAKECYPSCNYTWFISDKKVGFGSKLEYTVPPHVIAETVICKVENTLSGLFVETMVTLQVAQGPKAVTIRGPSSVMVGDTLMYFCFADCSPECKITWRYQGKTLTGDIVSVPILERGNVVLGDKLVVSIEDFLDTQNLQCTAVNTLSGKSMSVIKTLNVTDSVAVRPVTSTPPIAEKTYSLQCAGALPGSNIQWTKNWKPLATSDRVRLTDSSSTLSFNPLRQSDGGVYDCIVTEQGKIIPGIIYELNVIYGPLNPALTQSGNKQVEWTTILRPGSSVTFFCSAVCYPTCSYVWLLNKDIVATDATFSISSASSADEGSLTCVVFNSISNATVSVQTHIQLIGGPKDVTISGPKSVRVGQKSTFECSAVCTPPCVYTWDAYGRTLHGNKVELTVSHYVATETLACTARNIVTGKVATAEATIDVTDPDWCGC
ncbi:hypothetical protein ACEWY4_001455 [Coilia grayii]|uniref:Ig-like domain-containing protein n=1 Tax=Coilia grayii TaxID=363190 RepID=A0ABD1KT29_9TELE